MSVEDRGEIRNLPAYLHSKVLDHSDWQRGEIRLPRRITPSDVDTLFDRTGVLEQPTVFDGNGALIFAEWSRLATGWTQLPYGQRLLYENCIRDRTLPACAVLGGHNVDWQNGRQINTRTDITSFQVMVWDHEALFSEIRVGNENWQAFVFAWMGCVGIKNELSRAKHLRRRIIGYTVGMKPI